MKTYRKSFILTAILATLLFSCNKHSQKSQPGDLVARQRMLKKQIDSLKKELVKIEKKLRDSVQTDIPEITVDTVRTDTFAYYIDLQGVVKSDGNVNIVPLFQGEVLKIYKKVGDKVRKGELIMKLDDKILRNQIAEVRTQYNLAKTAYQRQKRLWEQKIGSEMAYLQAKTNYIGLQKKLRTLNEQLKKAKITSPINGTLDELMIKEGETAMPGRPVARIVNLNKVYVESDVSEKHLKEIDRGKPAIIHFPEAGEKIRAKIDYVGNFIHPNNRTFKIRIYTANKNNKLKPNLTANIQVLSRLVDSAVVIPAALIQEDANGHAFVFVLDSLKPDNEGRMIYTVKKQPVKTGLIYNKKAWIIEGLKPGDLLALTGTFGLTEGDKIYIKKNQQ